MKRIAVSLIIFCLAFSIPLRVAQGQLIAVDKYYRITKVDHVHHRLEVTYLNSQDVTLMVNIDGHTQVLNRHRWPLRWTLLKVGDVIRVKGGLAVGLQIAAKTVILQND